MQIGKETGTMLMSQVLANLLSTDKDLASIAELMDSWYHPSQQFRDAFIRLVKVIRIFHKIYDPTYEEDFFKLMKKYGAKPEPREVLSRPATFSFNSVLYITNLHECIFNYNSQSLIAIKFNVREKPRPICEISPTSISLQTVSLQNGDSSLHLQQIPASIIILAETALYDICKKILSKKLSQKPSNLEIIYNQLITITDLLSDISRRCVRQWYIPFDVIELFDQTRRKKACIETRKRKLIITCGLSIYFPAPSIICELKTPDLFDATDKVHDEFGLAYSRIHAVLKFLRMNASIQPELVSQLSNIIDQLKCLLRQLYQLYQIEKRDKRNFTPQLFEWYNTLANRHPEQIKKATIFMDKFIWLFKSLVSAEFHSFIRPIPYSADEHLVLQFNDVCIKLRPALSKVFYILHKGDETAILNLSLEDFTAPLLLCRPEHYLTVILDTMLMSPSSILKSKDDSIPPISSQGNNTKFI